MPIVLFTDFGSADPYVGQVHGVLAREAPGVPVIDLLNDAPAFRIAGCAHLLAALAPAFGPGAVFFAVVDPGVGGLRRPACVRANGQWFVGPDNGLLSVASARAREAVRCHIAWQPERLSASFHGRDLFAPMAARLATGRYAPDDLISIPGFDVDFGADDLSEVIYIDHYGNAFSGLRAPDPLDPGMLLSVGGNMLAYVRAFSEAPDANPFWTINSAGLVEVAANQANAAAAMALHLGTPVAWAA